MALLGTSSVDTIAADSANTASAYMTGHKSSVNALGVYADRTKASQDDPKQETIAELIRRKTKMAVGVVSDAEIEDATPASVVSHTRKRSDKADIVGMFYNVKPEVILGGGSAYFLPQSTAGSKRKDNINYIEKFTQAGYTLVTDPVLLRRMSEYTLGVFGKLADRLSHPLVRPWLSRLLPDVYRYVPVFRKMRREYAGGNDRILRGATAVLLIHAPKESRFGTEDANLAYQNASLMAEVLGVSQIYMGFVLTAVRQDRKKGLCRMLGLGGRRICAVMALGMPQFRYPNYIDRTPSPLERR